MRLWHSYIVGVTLQSSSAFLCETWLASALCVKAFCPWRPHEPPSPRPPTLHASRSIRTARPHAGSPGHHHRSSTNPSTTGTAVTSTPSLPATKIRPTSSSSAAPSSTATRRCLRRYKSAYPIPAAWAPSAFTQLAVQPLDAHFATVTGNFHLERTAAGGGNADGYFLLVVENTPAGWKIIRDSTTVNPPLHNQ